jgi:hypothetical protein
MTGLPEQGRETYLGDGLYVSFDGWQIVLRAPRVGGDHFVALEPEVYRALVNWIDSYSAVKRLMGQ